MRFNKKTLHGAPVRETPPALILLISAIKCLELIHGLGRTRQTALESLFVNFDSPLGASMLLNESESLFLIKMSRGVKPLKCPQIYFPVTPVPAKADRGIDKPVACSFSPQGIRQYEPPEMCTFAFGMNAVNRNRTFDTAVRQHSPKTVAALVVSLEKFRKFVRDFGFEEQPESPMVMVVGTMKFSDSSE
jgi:hypothetical protein